MPCDLQLATVYTSLVIEPPSSPSIADLPTSQSRSPSPSRPSSERLPEATPAGTDAGDDRMARALDEQETGWWIDPPGCCSQVGLEPCMSAGAPPANRLSTRGWASRMIDQKSDGDAYIHSDYGFDSGSAFICTVIQKNVYQLIRCATSMRLLSIAPSPPTIKQQRSREVPPFGGRLQARRPRLRLRYYSFSFSSRSTGLLPLR